MSLQNPQFSVPAPSAVVAQALQSWFHRLRTRLLAVRPWQPSRLHGRPAESNATRRRTGRVAIVGAGPGAADLLTLRALNCLRDADVVIYDKLVGPGILDLAAPKSLRIFVGKSRSSHTKTQDEINALLLLHAQRGHRVVRLKGGDPFIFGRGGEEQGFLRGHGIPVEIVPGVTAAAGCAAAAGLPLTHRGTAQAVTFLTGHAQDGEPDLPWAHLVQGGQTLVIYMGVSTAPVLARRLLEHGADPQTPVAVIENGTLASQSVCRGHLADLSGLMARNVITGPAVIVVGAVADLPEATLATQAALSHRDQEGVSL